MQTRERILKASDELFRQYGIKSITMDDIARHLSMSKKTIYRYFPDKDHIVDEEIKTSMEEVISDLNNIKKESKDAVDEILNILDYLNELFAYLNPSLFYDLQKYHHGAWKTFNDFQQDHLKKSLTDNLERGIEEGMYREDIHIPITAQLRMNQVMNTYDQNLFPPKKFNLREVHVQSLALYLYGITTLKGHRYIKRYQSKRTRISKRQKVSR